MKNIRLLPPSGEHFPEPVRQSVAYLFRNRWRMCYREFRAAGCPIGSGTVESACKLVVQQRLKQAGMRWSRSGAQSMLRALRSALLSDQWHLVERHIYVPLNSRLFSGRHPHLILCWTNQMIHVIINLENLCSVSKE